MGTIPVLNCKTTSEDTRGGAVELQIRADVEILATEETLYFFSNSILKY